VHYKVWGRRAAYAVALPAADLESAAAFARAEKAPSTRHAYRSDFALFRAWCAGKGVASLPASPETVAAFLAHEAERGSAASTITRRCAAIRYAHRLADLEPPTNSEKVRATLRGIRRTVGAAPARKAPVLAETARAMALAAPAGLKGTRDRALLLLGFAGAFCRSELVSLDVTDIEETEEGFKIIIRRSKTDQEGHGETIAIVRGGACCPVKAVKAWLQAAGIVDGALFRPVAKGGRLGTERLTDQSVCNIGLCRTDRTQGGRFRGSLLAGRLPDQRRAPRRQRVQDAGRVAAQVDGCVAGLRARRGHVPRSRGGGVALRCPKLN
jgi:site-specific recombinase XerC